MPLYDKNIHIDKVVYKGTELDELYYDNTLVWESTIYVPKPTVSGNYTFDNSAKSAVINGFDATAMVRGGTTSATAAGTYTVTFTLNPDYAWSDGTTAALSLTWKINKRTLAIPTLSNASFTWALNTTFKPTVNNFDGNYETQSGTASSTSSGTHTITWALKYSASTQWSDGTTANKSATWNVAKLALPIPYISGTKTFGKVDSGGFSVTVANFNTAYDSQSGTTSASAIGSYTVTWSLQYPSHTTWSDGTTGNKSGTWSIVAGTITWYINKRSGGGRGVYTFKTTYGVNFADLDGVWDTSNTSGDGRIKIVEGTTYAAYIMYIDGEPTAQDAIRNEHGTQYAKTDVPVNGGTYY